MAQRPMLIVTVILCTAYIVSAQCPGICDCSSYDSRKEIRCGRDLTSIPSSLPPDTQILRLEFNRIENISATDFSRMVNLKRLTLYNNMISFIDTNAFQYQQDLEVLNLKYNRIRFIHCQTFRNTQKLVELSLDNNLLQSIENDTFNGLVKLNELEIDGNPLQSLPEGIFNGLTNLRLLDISNVVFEVIPSNLFDGLTSLETLKMNNVTQNGDHLFGSEFIFASVPTLITLEFSQNSLHCLPGSLEVLRALKVLKLSMNPLTCSNFTVLKHLQHLEELHMEGSGITTLSSNMFVGNTNLVFLLIEYSSLSTVEEGACVTGLSRLEDLYLSSNNITTLPDHVFDSLPSGVNLDIADNPWYCDCYLRWLHTWLTTSYTGNTPDERQPECVSPNRLIGQRIIDIVESEYACMPQTELNETMTHSVNEGENFVIECSITADPSPDLHWLTPDHTELFPNTNQIPFIVDSESTLTIIRIRKEDAGTYSCTGTNAAGTLNIRNVVNVVGTGNAPIFRTDSNLQSSTTITSQQSEPLEGGNYTMLVISIAVVAFLIVLVVVVVIVAVIRRRNKRRDRFRHGPEAAFRNGRATLPSLPSCTTQDNMAMPYAASDDRYTLQRPPTTSVFDPPPPYSTIPSSPNDDIYQEIKTDDDLYEKPREPGDMSPTSVRPDHTYMIQVLRQDSFVSNGSGGVPAGYERSMIRDVGKPKSDTSSTRGSAGCSDQPANGAQRNIYVATNDVKDNNRQSNTEHNDLRVRVPDLDPEAKATYENTRRT
eukprot:XP_011665896.1 PREDICTED: LOW QUALITY PROTEIN: leucine-rich repeat and immunoglobulin-like domain-containing nogo receptor-interacting protein 3 [Strongylocentrotus purpuratus]